MNLIGETLLAIAGVAFLKLGFDTITGRVPPEAKRLWSPPRIRCTPPPHRLNPRPARATMGVRENLLDRLRSRGELIRERNMWRAAYEALVAQTGRDLNDGYGRDPRKPTSTPAKPDKETR